MTLEEMEADWDDMEAQCAALDEEARKAAKDEGSLAEAEFINEDGRWQQVTDDEDIAISRAIRDSSAAHHKYINDIIKRRSESIKKVLDQLHAEAPEKATTVIIHDKRHGSPHEERLVLDAESGVAERHYFDATGKLTKVVDIYNYYGEPV